MSVHLLELGVSGSSPAGAIDAAHPQFAHQGFLLQNATLFDFSTDNGGGFWSPYKQGRLRLYAPGLDAVAFPENIRR